MPGAMPSPRKSATITVPAWTKKPSNAKGVDPLKPELERIANAKDKAALIEAIARVHLIGPNPLFNFYSSPDLHNANDVIAYIDQGGLSLPDRDYYLKDDPKMADARKSLVEYATQLFTLTGQSPKQAADSAQTVLRIETALAKASMDRTARRDPKNRDHKMTRDEAVALAPNFYLDRYFRGHGHAAVFQLERDQPGFLQAGEWRSGIRIAGRAANLRELAPARRRRSLALPALRGRQLQDAEGLTGQSEIKPRWKRCVSSTDDALGEALGQRYVEQTFGADGKQRMLKMVDALEKSLDQDIQNLPWMTEETKKQAKVKLDAIRNKIGYPDVWRDYSSLKIVRGDLLGNFLRANEFEARRQIAKIGKPRGPQRVGDDAAHGQRLLQPAEE